MPLGVFWVFGVASETSYVTPHPVTRGIGGVLDFMYDIPAVGSWLVVSFLLGIVVGWATESAVETGPWRTELWFKRVTAAFVAGVALSWTHWLGLWFEFWLNAALLLFTIYVMGCMIGGLARFTFATPKAPRPVAVASPPAVAPAETPPPAPEPEIALSEPVTHVVHEPAAELVLEPQVEPAPMEIAPPALEPGLAPIEPSAHAVHEPAAAAPFAELAPEPPVEPALAQIPSPAPEPELAALEPVAAFVHEPVAVAPKPVEPEAASVPEPAVIGRVEGEDNHEGQRPVGFVSPPAGLADDLQRIKGIGPQNETRLRALGIWRFEQIAAWTPENARWIGSFLAFPGRVDRDQWIDQAKILAAGGEPQGPTGND
jgi:predicted flap endonuclease-1-like 5' DNA nuclease